MSVKRKKLVVRVISILLLVAMFIGTIASLTVYGVEIKYTDKDGKVIRLSDFRDTQGHWAQGTILRWAEYDIINGYQGNFMPNSPVKRGDLAIMLDRLMGLRVISYNYFTDLPNNSYYRDSVLRAVAEGYFTGTGDNKINPEGYATREEVAVILARAFNFDTSKSGYIPVKDNYMISHWARPSINALYDLGYMRGDGSNMNPRKPVTRAEIITLFNNIAEMYIPQKTSGIGTGNVFSNTVKNNIVIARSGIELVRSVVGRDIVLTQSARGFKLSNSKVDGRLLVLGSGSIEINNSKIGRIELHEKVTINGITDDIGEIYITNLGSESTLDKIPRVLYLEPGVRVRIEGTMYENTENRVKKYTGLEIKADIANEQGYVAGGPRVTTKYVHSVDNIFEFKDVRITEGQNGVSIAGVVVSKGTTVPSLQDYDYKYDYKGRTDRLFNFTAGKVVGEMTYRFYVMDNNGLIGYSEPITVQAYNFSTELNIYDLNYPESIRVEVILKGDNIPEISSIRVPYGENEIYSEQLQMVTLSLDNDPYKDKTVSDTGFRRYVGEIKSRAINVDGEQVYNPPTFFGYIFTFANGNVDRKFPVLSNAIPEGISPVEILSTGNAEFGTNNRLIIKNNRLKTRHIEIQEAGIVYRVVPEGTIVQEPNINWNKQITYINAGVRDLVYYNTTLTNIPQEGETHFASYVKTPNGYYYGNVKVLRNNWKGSEDGPRILGTPNVKVLSDTQALVEIPVKIKQSLNHDKFNTIISFTDRDGKNILRYSGASLNETNWYLNQAKDKLYIYFEDLSPNMVYNVIFQLYDISDKPSNLISFDINTNDKLVMSFTNKVEKTSETIYDLIKSPELNGVEIDSVKVVNENYSAYISTNTNPWKLTLRTIDTGEKTVEIKGRYYVARSVGNIKSFSFVRYEIVR